MTQSTILVAVITTAVLASSDINAEKKWQKHGAEDGISVFTSRFPASNVPNVKAITIVNAPTEKVWNYITNTIQMNGLKDKRTIDSCGAGCNYVYVRLGNWMITDRHYVIKVNWRTKDVDGHTGYVREWTQTSERRAKNPEGMPVRSIQGSWTLTPVNNGKQTRITYINHLDLGGSVPASLFARGFVKNAYEILRNIRTNA